MKNSSVLLFLVLSLGACTQIEVGQKGVLFRPYSGGLDKEHVYNEGVEWVAPWNDMIVYDVREQSRDYKSQVLEKNGLTVTITATVNFAPISSEIGNIHADIGVNYADIIVDKKARGAIKDVVGKYTAEELYSTKRGKLESEISAALDTALAQNHISFRFVEISDVDLPDPISNAITAKEEQQQKNLLAEKRKEEEENLAAARVAREEGNYNAAVFQAKANREIANSISAPLVEWEKLKVLEKNWDGKYPQVMSDAGVLLNLNK